MTQHTTNAIADQRQITLGLRFLRTAIESLDAAADHVSAAGRLGWEDELRTLAKATRVWERTIEDKR